MIPKSDCKNRQLYRIHSRNLSLGIFRESTGGFVGLRTKFGSVYAFEEYHWDNGEPHGTVKPIEELSEELPAEIEPEVDLGSICDNCKVLCEYIKFPDGPHNKDYGDGKLVPVRGEWKHIGSSDCVEVFPVILNNEKLEQWLRTMEKKHGQ